MNVVPEVEAAMTTRAVALVATVSTPNSATRGVAIGVTKFPVVLGRLLQWWYDLDLEYPLLTGLSVDDSRSLACTESPEGWVL